MVSKTSGGLIKFSVALDEETVATLNRLTTERGVGASRSDVLREALRLGLPLYEHRQRMFDSLSPIPQVKEVPA